MVKIEVCAEAIESAKIAQACGASRIELCADMAQGGTTQSYGTILAACRELTTPVFPIIRPRGGDFVYSESEFAIIADDIRFCGEAGCKGIVTGILYADGTVDGPRTAKLVGLAASYGMEVTFHRAFDVCGNLEQALETIIETGCSRILTSGGEATAFEGSRTISALVKKAAGRISIMPGSEVTPQNAPEIIRLTGCKEIHGTFSHEVTSPAMRPDRAEFTRKEADPVKIKQVIANLSQL